MTRVQPRVVVDMALLALIAACALVVVYALQPVRPFVVLAAATLVPGGALVTRLRTGEAAVDLALAIGLSLALDITGSLALAWTGWWHPEALAIALGTGSAMLLLLDLVLAWRR